MFALDAADGNCVDEMERPHGEAAMTAPALPDALGVECPRCLALRGKACWASTDWMVLKTRKPHAARIARAEREQKEGKK
jgi:hypothetical protein